jgi:hypothetical protein
MQEGRIAIDVIGNAVEVMPIAKGEETDSSSGTASGLLFGLATARGLILWPPPRAASRRAAPGPLLRRPPRSGLPAR